MFYSSRSREFEVGAAEPPEARGLVIRREPSRDEARWFTACAEMEGHGPLTDVKLEAPRA